MRVHLQHFLVQKDLKSVVITNYELRITRSVETKQFVIPNL